MVKCSGGCLCGEVTYKTELKGGVGACHCGKCRRWSGGIFMSVHAAGKIDLQGSEHLGIYASSDWAKRVFCKVCGTNLYYHLLPHDKFPSGQYILSAGTLDSQENLVFDHEVYVDHKPSWYALDGESQRQRMTEADILALYGEN